MEIGYYMEKHKNLMPVKNEEGLEKALSEDNKFAFISESSFIQYITERHCSLTQIGDLLDDKNYGIGTRKGSELI